MWHHFGDYAEERAHDLVHMYKNYFNNDVKVCKCFFKRSNLELTSMLSPLQPANLAKLAEQYIWRSAINMHRENNIEERGDTQTLKVRLIVS
jgi:hypothetical protein